LKPLILPKNYWDSEIYNQEKESLFLACWHYVGLQRSFAKENDFITCDIASFNVVIQNINNKIRAFTNVCTHRFSKIQTEESGNRPLLCQYHGWFFDETGRPKGIPHKPHFGNLNESDIQRLCLTPWQVASVGEFVFIAHQTVSQSLVDYLGESAQLLIALSQGLGDEVDCNRIMMDCNWKIAVENTLESYHVPTIHAQTFYKLGTSGENFKFQKAHSSWETSVNDKTAKQLQPIDTQLDTRPFKTNGYLHLFIFPNLTIASTLGTSFSIQTFIPINPGETCFTSRVYETRLEKESSKTKAIQKIFNHSVIDFNRRVFEEDRLVCNQVQLGISMVNSDGILSDIEYRIHAFQTHYRHYINA
jgi:phenylpropionate dioxygenase-like ring-hydroxylating dioxygenase large terminal subunit